MNEVFEAFWYKWEFGGILLQNRWSQRHQKGSSKELNSFMNAWKLRINGSWIFSNKSCKDEWWDLWTASSFHQMVSSGSFQSHLKAKNSNTLRDYFCCAQWKSSSHWKFILIHRRYFIVSRKDQILT